MENHRFYTSAAWRTLRAQVLARDANRCTVGGLLGGACTNTLHVHHLQSLEDRPDLALDPDNCATSCSAHHPQWDALRRQINQRRDLDRPRCPHTHRSLYGRLQCEARLARRKVAA